MSTCPLCSSYGLTLFITGLVIMLLPFQCALWLGMALIISAYIIPNLIPQSCRVSSREGETCVGKKSSDFENKKMKYKEESV